MPYHKSVWASVFLSFLHSLVFIAGVDVRNMTIDEYVNYINPPALHKYQDEFGDSILCVKHSHQISLHPEGHSKKGLDISDKGLKISGKGCPEGSVGVREIKYQHVERAGSVARFLGETNSVINPDGTVEEDAYIKIMAATALKVEAFINTWSPYVTKNDGIYSRSEMYVTDHTQETVLLSGWQVNPGLYGDQRPRLYTYWTVDEYNKTGCYDLLCPGFVMASGSIVRPGSPIGTISTYEGTQHEFQIKMSLETISDISAWGLYVNSVLVGYWPASLVPALNESAYRVYLGGAVKYHAQGGGNPYTNTDMGSGHFPSMGAKKAAYIRKIQITAADGRNQVDLPNYPFVTKNECYDMQQHSYPEPWGLTIYYGGPGGDADKCRSATNSLDSQLIS